MKININKNTLLTISVGFGIEASYSGSLFRTFYNDSNAFYTFYVSPYTPSTNYETTLLQALSYPSYNFLLSCLKEST